MKGSSTHRQYARRSCRTARLSVLRRYALASLVAWVVTADASGISASSAARMQKPNIVFILADDIGWGDLSAYGHPELRTPNLDRLASQGALFTQFYVNSPVCSPSRAAFLTGTYPARLGIHAHIQSSPADNSARGVAQWLDPRIPNIASTLKSAGYRTAHIGKWHLGPQPGSPGASDPTHPEIQEYGFDFVRGDRNPGSQKKQDAFYRARSTALFVDEALQFITANRDRPFYLQLWPIVPHAPLNPTSEQMKPFEHFFSSPTIPYRGAQTIYYAAVADLDTQVGRLIREIDALGLGQNTIVIFASDNGPEDIHVPNASYSAVGSVGPFRGRKRSLYEGGVRVPFIVRWPGRIPTHTIDDSSVLAGIDFYPTIARLAGVRAPSTSVLDGQDRSEVLLGKPAARTRPLFWEWRFNQIGDTIHRSPMLAIRDGDWKLLMNPDQSRIELYDIVRDPSELNNVAKLQTTLTQELSEKLLAWRKTLPPGPVDPTAGRNTYRWPSQAH